METKFVWGKWGSEEVWEEILTFIDTAAEDEHIVRRWKENWLLIKQERLAVLIDGQMVKRGS